MSILPPRSLAALALAVATTLPARAANPIALAADPTGLLDYQHTAWTAAEGAPPRIGDMAQTEDGWLWLATPDGLFRFDGVRFERFVLPPWNGLARDRINAVYAAPGGDLYVSYSAEGLSVVHPDGRVAHLPPQDKPYKGIGTMVLDGEGSLWTVAGDIRRLRGGRWEMMAEGEEWRGPGGASLLLDAAGQVWAANATSVWRFERARGRFARVADGGGELLLAPNGQVWLVREGHAPRALNAPAGARPPGSAQATGHWAGLFDSAGALWTLDCLQPQCMASEALHRRLPGAFAAPAGPARAPVPISGTDLQALLEDREGNIWVATENGIDRYRRNRFTRAGLAGSGVRYSMATDWAGRMWAADGDSGTLLRLEPGSPPRVEAQAGPVTVIARGRDGALLVGGLRAIERRSAAGTETVALPPGPDGKPRDYHMIGILDDGKVLWTATMETGLIGWRDGKWWPPAAFNLPAKIYQSAPDGPGQLWLATGDGKLVFYDNDELASWDIRAVGLASAIFPGQPLTVGGTSGFGALVKGRLRLLRAADRSGDGGTAADALRNISGMVVTPDGDRWLNGAAGLVHVRALDWRASMDDPDQPLRYEVLGQGAGYPGRAVVDNRWPSAMSADGRNLWLAGTAGLVRFDTAGAGRNTVPPRPVVLGVAVGDTVYPARAQVVLPPGAGQFRIQFTAPALRMPERIRFAYRLDGFDAAWVDGGTRRETAYTNIAPGDYVFRVRAVNEDGVAGATEASLRLRIEPTMTQTLWFKLACGAGLALLAALLYRYRVRYVTARLTERLRIRTAERERIARTLHDTFLQTVQALVLRVDAVAARMAPQDPARAQLEDVLADAGRAIGEGRGQLQELRAGDAHVLEDVVADAVARLRGSHGWIEVDLGIEGERRALHAAVSEEIAEILREALRNAFTHAGARRIGVTVDYGPRMLGLTIADDGKGIDAAVRKGGSLDGHFGLVGMRERAARIGARLEIDSAPGAGTTIALAVPGARAYAP